MAVAVAAGSATAVGVAVGGGVGVDVGAGVGVGVGVDRTQPKSSKPSRPTDRMGVRRFRIGFSKSKACLIIAEKGGGSQGVFLLLPRSEWEWMWGGKPT
jgi:hypothetical protein